MPRPWALAVAEQERSFGTLRYLAVETGCVNQKLTNVSTFGLHRGVDDIIQAQQAVDLARARLYDAVTAARRDGRSWAEIGELLGMSRQAAFKRFGTTHDPRTGEIMKTRSIDEAHRLTEEIFRLIAHGDDEAVQAHLHPQVRDQLTPQRIGDAWRSALSECGSLETFANTHVELHDGTVLTEDEAVVGTVIGATQLMCEAGELVGRVAFDETDQVVGLLIVPPGHGKLPF